MRSMRMLNRWFGRDAVVLGSAGIALTLVAFAAFGQADPVVGTWRQNVAASTYSQGPGPRQGITTIEAVPGGLRLVNEGINAQGEAMRLEYTAMLDGRDYPAQSTNPNAPNTVAITKIDDHHYEVTGKRNGEVRTVTRWAISADGRTRTNTVTGTNAEGQPVNDTVVFDKE